MSSVQDTVSYDPINRCWQSAKYPHWDFIRQSIGDMFLRQMRTIQPDKVLEYYYDNDEERTAQQIYEESVTVAINLQKMGIKRGDIIALYMMSSPHAVTLAMGAILIGAVMNFFETQMERANIDSCLKNLQPAVIVYANEYEETVLESIERLKLTSIKYVCALQSSTKSTSIHKELLQAIPLEVINKFQAIKIEDPENELACLVMTSGSSGVPKQTELTHSALLCGISPWWFETMFGDSFDANTVIFSFSPLRWITQTSAMFASILHGVKRCCVSGLPEGVYGSNVIKKSKITHLFITPSMFADILEAIPANDSQTLASVRAVMLGGEYQKQAILESARYKATNSIVYYCYGATEIGLVAHHEHINGGHIGIGINLKILDDNMETVGPNVRGQLCFKTVAPFKGYYRYDSHDRFLPDGYFMMGDCGYMDEQNKLHIDGRCDDLVRSNGAIIVPLEVETLLTELPEVKVTCLVGHKEKQSDRDEIVTLFVVKSKLNKTISNEELRLNILKLLSTKLTSIDMACIQRIYFINEIPITTCGKLNRAALKKQASQM